MFRGGMSASSVTKAGNIDIAFGKNINLKTFANRTASNSFHSWEQIPGYSTLKSGFNNFEDAFRYAAQSAVNTNGKIFFNLEYVNLQAVGNIKAGTGLYQKLDNLGGKSLWEMNMTTEWELSQVLNNKQLLKITEFQKMGKSVPLATVKAATEAKTK